MDSTLLIGIAVVIIGTGAGAFVMFGQRATSLAEDTTGTGTLSAAPRRPTRDLSTATGPRPPVPRALRSDQVNVRWYQRLRAGLVLVIITVGIGMAIGAVLGIGALAVSLFLS